MAEQRDYKNIKIGADTFWRANRLKLLLRESGQKCSYDDLIIAGMKHLESKYRGLCTEKRGEEAAYAEPTA